MKNIFSIIFLGIVNISISQSLIDVQQTRIDKLDGKMDSYIAIKDLDSRNSAINAYLLTIDEIENKLNTYGNISSKDKSNIEKELVIELKKVTSQSLLSSVRAEEKFLFLDSWLESHKNNTALKLMNENRHKTFSIIQYIYNFQETEIFLKNLPNNFIDIILHNYNYISRSSYGQGLLEGLIKKAPLTSKKYFVSGQPVYDGIFSSKDPVIEIVYSINEQFKNTETKAYVLIDKIMDGELSIYSADANGNSKEYYRNLLEIRSKKDPLAEVSLDRELTYEALNFVGEVNRLHESTNPDVRFGSVNNLSAAELYTLIVYSEDEIFTSTFNGIYERLNSKMKEENLSGFQLLENVGFNKFRVLIKMISYYGKLNEFLATMKKKERDIVLRKFINGIENSEQPLNDAVSIVDAISAIEDKDILKIFEQEIYRINENENLDKNTRLINALLVKMFLPKTQIHHSYFQEVSDAYFLPPIDRIEHYSSLGRDGVNVQKHFFYDDEDGQASYRSFLNSFKSSDYVIKEEGKYITLTSNNGFVKIYANLPEHDETAWYYADKEISRNGEDVEFIIHRGHSYYVDETIEKIPRSSKLILLGSCGGYNKLSLLLNKSDNAHIISTKQIGSMGVNNPLIFKMAEKIRKGESLVWSDYWNDLKVHFKGKGKTQERFEDYVPPHKNLGAKFIAAYNMYSWVK